MSAQITRLTLAILSVALAAALLTGCGQNRSKSAHDRDTLVPQAQQREAERNMGEQQMMMEELNMTPAERAAAQHQRTMDRRHDRQNEDE